MNMNEAWILVLAQIGSVFLLVLVVFSAGEIIAEARWWISGSLARVIALAIFGLLMLWGGTSLWDVWA
jgi:hypothetical protein